jgi:heptosyltransferase II
MRKVLVIRFSSLGDVVLTGPIFDALHKAWPNAEITALTKEQFADVYKGSPAVNQVMTLKRGESLRSLVQRVRTEKFDVVIDLHANLRSRMVSLFSGARQRVRYQKAALARRLYVGWRVNGKRLAEHTLDRYRETLRGLGIHMPPKRLLVIQTAFLGDAVLTLPFIDALHQRYPSAYITVLCTPEVADVFRQHSGIGDVIIFDKRGKDRGIKSIRRIANVLREQSFEVAFIPHRSFKSALFAWLAGIPQRIGFSTSEGRWMLTQRVPFQWETHDADRNLMLLQAVGEAPPVGRLSLTPDPHASQTIMEQLRDAGIGPTDRILGINAGSVWATKRWLPDGFAAVADRAICELGMKVIFFGGPSDRPAVESVLRTMRERPIDWVGKTPLKNLIAAIGRCSVFLTNDSGPMHIAVACGVPTVAVFGPTTRELGFFPYGSGHIVVEKDLACRPCGLHGAKTCPLGHFQCMTTISVDDVFAAVSSQAGKNYPGKLVLSQAG